MQHSETNQHAQTGKTSAATEKEGQWILTFDGGTLLLEMEGRAPAPEEIPDGCCWDSRVERYRARACDYRPVRTAVHRSGVPYDDQAARYNNLELVGRMKRKARPYQQEAIDEWCAAGKKGIVVLPTGTGKSFVAELAMLETQRSTLVVAPTIDLMNQWYDILSASFQLPVGLLGGGYHEIEDLTVTTYDSAYIHMDRLGNRFGLVIFDEIHHLPGPTYLHAAECCLAPFRLGMTATLERADGRHELLEEIVGPVVYRRSIRELSGEYLAEYEVQRLVVSLDPEEFVRYTAARETYRQFVREKGIRFGDASGWGQFVAISSRSAAGRRAMRAFQEARRLALAAPSKLKDLDGLLRQHWQDRVIIFTNDNDTVYNISRTFLIPAITHQTDTKERKELLERFNKGAYPTLVTSRVLNEGVNIPAANVGIVLSGTGSVREHVQRLGRILRPQEGKQAILYEMVTQDTVEEFVSERRREHDAYKNQQAAPR